jgi:peptidoglycan/LPS O-acetylase OafA/YrhL
MFQSIVAIIAGFLTTAVLVMAGTAVASAVMLPGRTAGETTVVPTPYLSVNLVLSILAAIAGGYVCGWIAPRHPFSHAAILAGVFGLLSLYTAVTTGAAPGQPHWYPWVIGTICVAGVLAGGALRAASEH